MDEFITSVVVFPMARYSRGTLTVEVSNHLVPYMIDLSKGYTILCISAKVTQGFRSKLTHPI